MVEPIISDMAQKADAATPRLSPVPDVFISKSPSSNAKNELQELLQKSIYNYPPPTYKHLSPRGPSHKREFTCVCAVVNHRNEVIHQTQGTGGTKKEAEMNSAAEMKPVIMTMLEKRGQLVPVSVDVHKMYAFFVIIILKLQLFVHSFVPSFVHSFVRSCLTEGHRKQNDHDSKHSFTLQSYSWTLHWEPI